jgi:polysaccharide biosynthesis transport protein
MGALMDPSTEQPLAEYLRIISRRKWWIILITLLVVGASLGFSFKMTKKYTATAQVLAQTTNPPAAQTEQTQPLTTTQLATYVQLATSPAVLAGVRTDLGITGKPPAVSVSLVGATNLIAISATSTRATAAARIANDYANAFSSYELSVASSQAKTLLNSYTLTYTTLSSELSKDQAANDSSAEIAIAAQEAVIAQDLALAESAVNNPSGAISVVSPAAVPTSPSSPKPVVDGLVGLLVGVLLGLALVVVADYRDDRLRSAADVQLIARDCPILAAIPMIESWKKKNEPKLVSLTEPSSSAVEAYWSLRAGLRFLAHDTRLRSLLITSPAESEGKTSTIANFGVILARGGQATLIVSCDLRRPRLREFFIDSARPGLTSVLLREVELHDAVQPVPNVPNLYILDSGPLPPDPHRVLASAVAARIFEELTENFEMVLIDSPPLLPVADALVLGQLADATMLVAAVGQTKKSELQRAMQMLEAAHVPLAGIILNEVTRESSYGYGYYGYGGYSSYRQESDASQGVGNGSEGLKRESLNGNGAAAHRNGSRKVAPADEQMTEERSF